MSDTQTAFILLFTFITLGVVLRRFMATYIGILQPYREGVLRCYSDQALRAVWMWRLGFVLFLSIASLSYAFLGIVTTVIFIAAYFFSGLFFQRLESSNAESEALSGWHG